MIVQYPPLPLLKASSSKPQIKTSKISKWFLLDTQYKSKGPCLSFHFYSTSYSVLFHAVQILTFSRRLPASLLPPACPTRRSDSSPKIQFSCSRSFLEGLWLGRVGLWLGGADRAGEEDWNIWHGGGPEASWMTVVKPNQKSLQKTNKQTNKHKLWLRKSQEKNSAKCEGWRASALRGKPCEGK